MSEAQTINVDPAVVLIDDNIRYNLKAVRLASLKADILEYGGIHTPVELEPLSPPVNGKQYRVTVGHYRMTAATELNRDEKAGLLVPAVVKAPGSSLDRLKRQLSENLEREDLSPIDKAVAIDKLLKEGVSKSDIRVIFSRAGGKKGTELIPVSNAWVNMTHSFLTLPKAIQQKIHDGLVGVAAAYELTKVSPEKREAVLERAESARQKELADDQKEEEKLLNSEKKAAEANAKVEAEKMHVTVLKDELELAEKELAAKIEAGKEAFSATKKPGQSEEEKAKAIEHFKATDADIKGAEKLVTTKQKTLTSLEQKVTGTSKVAAGLKERLANARKAKDKKGKGKTAAITPKSVKEAAKAEGDGNHVALTIAEVRGGVRKMISSSFPTVKKFGKSLQSFMDGVLTDNQMIEEIAVFIGDKPAPKVKAAK